MSRKITLGMGKRGAGRGGNQITLGYGSSFLRVLREVLRACSRLAEKLELTSVIKWRRTQ